MQGVWSISIFISANITPLHNTHPVEFRGAAFRPAGNTNYLRFQTLRSQLNKSCCFAVSPCSLENNASKITGEKESRIDGYIARIKEMFADAENRQISASAYDTAWVAMVPSSQGSPQFPQCLAWLIDNQLSDGSWGIEPLSFLTKDRLFHTLACVIALKTWNIADEQVRRGLRFIGGNIGRITSRDDYTPGGFQSIFPAMLEDARGLGLELPFDSSPIKQAMLQREEILNGVSSKDMGKASLVHSLEGIRKIVDWEKVIKHQNEDGSLFNSPSATACTLMHTGNVKCLHYLNSLLQKFTNGGVPSVYPMHDVFTLTLMVDRLERLGIGRYFKDQIMDALDYVYGMWARNDLQIRERESSSSIPDMAFAFMAFRLLRWNGYDVSADALCLQKDGEFLCCMEQSGQAVTAMLNVYRASQIMFPGESILEAARTSSKNFLQEKRASGRIHDESVILKDLPGEVEHALSYPWSASLERLENRRYIEQYGVDDIWIAKTSYKIPCVSNEYFLALAKEYYNICQAKQQEELQELARWFESSRFSCLKFARQKLVYCYFSVAATLFEPELSAARMAWTKNAVLATVVDDFFDVEGSIPELHSLVETVRRWNDSAAQGCTENVQILFSALYNTMKEISEQAFAFQGWDVSNHLTEIWSRLVGSMMKEAEWANGGYTPSMEEYMANGKPSIALEPIVLPALYLVGPQLTHQIIHHPEYENIMELLNMCGRLLNDIQTYRREAKEGKLNSVGLYMRENSGSTEEDAIAQIRKLIDGGARELLREVLKRGGAVPQPCKKLHWNMLTILQRFYHERDEYTCATEMLQDIEALIFKPIS